MRSVIADTINRTLGCHVNTVTAFDFYDDFLTPIVFLMTVEIAPRWAPVVVNLAS